MKKKVLWYKKKEEKINKGHKVWIRNRKSKERKNKNKIKKREKEKKKNTKYQKLFELEKLRFQFCTKNPFRTWVERVLKQEEEISRMHLTMRPGIIG